MPSDQIPRIAVVGMSGVFPNANDCSQMWRNIVDKIDATADVPSYRWIAPYDWVLQAEHAPDKAYANRACLVRDFHFAPDGLDLEPEFAKKLDPLHQWVLHAARDALLSSKMENTDKSRIGTILAAIVLPTELASRISRNLMANRLFEEHLYDPDLFKLPQAESMAARVVSTPATISLPI